MNERIKATLEALMQRYARSGDTQGSTLSRDIARYIQDPSQGLSPAVAALLIPELRAQGITLTSQQMAQLMGPQAGSNTGPELGGVPGQQPALTSGTGQQQTVADKAKAAAIAATQRGPTQTPNDPTNPYRAPATPAAGTDPNTRGLGAPASAAASQQAALTAGPGNSAFTPAQGLELSRDDDRLIRFAMQQAGLNPDRLTGMTRRIGAALVPLLRSARSAYGIANDEAVNTMPDFFSQLAQSLTQKGGNFFGQLRNLGESTMNSANFANYLGGINDPEAQAAMIQSLLPIRYAGSNPLIQQSVADTAERGVNAFRDTVFNNSGAVPNGGIFLDWLKEQPNVDPITARIFGIGR